MGEGHPVIGAPLKNLRYVDSSGGRSAGGRGAQLGWSATALLITGEMPDPIK